MQNKGDVTAGRLDAAEQAFIEGIAAAEEMGMVRDMLNMMVKVAKVWGQRGQIFEAVGLLVTVLAAASFGHGLMHSRQLHGIKIRAEADIGDSIRH